MPDEAVNPGHSFMKIFDMPCLRELLFEWVRHDIMWGDAIMESMVRSNFKDMIRNKSLLNYFLTRCVKTLSVATYRCRLVPRIVLQGNDARGTVYYDCIDLTCTKDNKNPFYRVLRRWQSLESIHNVVVNQKTSVNGIASMTRRLPKHQLTLDHLSKSGDVLRSLVVFPNASVLVMRFTGQVSFKMEHVHARFPKVHTLVVRTDGMFVHSASMVKQFLLCYVSSNSSKALFPNIETMHLHGAWAGMLSKHIYVPTARCLVLEDLVCVQSLPFLRCMAAIMEENYPNVNEVHMAFQYRPSDESSCEIRKGFCEFFLALGQHSVVFVDVDTFCACRWDSKDESQLLVGCR